MRANHDRRATLGWGAVCLLLSAAIIVECRGVDLAPAAAAAPVEPPPVVVSTSPAAPLGALQAYAAVIERPLFSQSRRPPPSAEDVAQLGTQGNLSVAGILISGQERIALLRQGTNRKLTRIREGQSIENWTIRTIADDRVTLAGRGGEATLLLQTKQAAAKAGH